MLSLCSLIFKILLELKLCTKTCLKSSLPTNPGIFKCLLYNLHETKEGNKCYSSTIDFFKQSN